MKTRVSLAASVSALAVLSAHSAQAQEFYYGVGVETMPLELALGPVLRLARDITAGSILGGISFATPGGFRYGAELETSLLNDVSATVAIDINGITRVRGLAGYDFQNFSLFGSLGYTWIGEDIYGGFGSASGAEGISYGIGADVPISDRVSIRIEALRNELELNSGIYEGSALDGNSLRLGAIIKF